MKNNQIIEEFLKDLSEEYQKEFLKYLDINNAKNLSDIRKILSEFRKIKGFKKVGKFTIDYWIQRGWDKETALIKKKENRVNNIPNGSPMQIKYWTCRVNEKTGNLYTQEEAIYKIKSQRKFNKEYWMERGNSLNDSIIFAAREQNKNLEKANEKGKIDPSFYFNRTWNQIGYWKKKGLSEEEAKNKVSELQNKNSLNSIIKKYGEVEGIERYENISKNLSFSQSLEGYIKRYGKTIGEEKYKKSIHKKTAGFLGVSKESIRFFLPIYKKLREKIKREDIFWGIGGSKEYFLWDDNLNKIFFYDFTILPYKIIIEFNGIHWHPNPSWSEEKLSSWRCFNLNAEEKRSADLYKIDLAKKKGFDVIEIFSDEKENLDMDQIIKRIIKCDYTI